MKIEWYLSLAALFLCISCGTKGTREKKESVTRGTYTNPLLPSGTDPSAVFLNGKYYYTHGTEDKILLWATSDITDLAHATCKTVWLPKEASSSYHLWAPDINYINNKWYIYFAADDGNTDNHQLYVIENTSPDPMKGEFKMKGCIMTNKEWNWGIHASTFVNKGVQYLLWSGWPKRRISAETQCIYIAKMKDPWTLDSPRILISKPEHEWERQWVNPDGSRTAYPIYVNEGPEYFHSKGYKKVIVYYSASGCWSPYYCVGMLTADADSDLLNPASWTKSPVPVFSQSLSGGVYGPGSVSFVPSPDGKELYMLYQARDVPNGDTGGPETRSPRMQRIDWDVNGMPVLGIPVRDGVALPKPSGTPVR
nr:glycoside hydrolase family 43 protein [uncultured Bacteroides sp.]